MILMVIMALCNLVTDGHKWVQLVIPGHCQSPQQHWPWWLLLWVIWSQMVTTGHRWSHLSLGQVYLLVLVSILSTLPFNGACATIVLVGFLSTLPFHGACATKWQNGEESTLPFTWCLCHKKWQKERRLIDLRSFAAGKKAMKKGWQFELQEAEGRILDRVRTYQNVKGAL